MKQDRLWEHVPTPSSFLLLSFAFPFALLALSRLPQVAKSLTLRGIASPRAVCAAPSLLPQPQGTWQCLGQQCSCATPPVPPAHSHFSFCLLLLSQPLLLGSLAAADGDQVLLPTSRRCALAARRVIYFLFLLLNTPNSLNGAESN